MTKPSPSAPALIFRDQQLDIISRDGQQWLRGLQIGGALGYAKPDHAIWKLYEKHAEEFTEHMTAVVKLPTAGGDQEQRIFSLRGAHLLGMFARTGRAAEFRRWVLDILERENGAPQPALPTPYTVAPGDSLSAEQAETLRRMVTETAATLPKERRAAFVIQGWSKLKAHFHCGYRQIPQGEFPEAISLLARHIAEHATAPALPAPEKISPALRAAITRKAHAVALGQYDTIHTIIRQAVLDNLACGATEASCEGYLDTYGQSASGVALCNVRDLQELVSAVGSVIDKAGSAIATIQRIERRSGYQLYGRTKRAEWENPEFHKFDQLVQEVIERISGGDEEEGE